MASLVPFLKKEDLNAMPMGLAMTLSIWPSQTHNHIVKLLAGYVLPILLGKYVPIGGGGGGTTYFFGLKIYTLDIFLGQEICHVLFLGLISERTFRFGFSL